MAVINNKMLIKKYNWSKISPSARILFYAGFTTGTDKQGIGSPSWGYLMTTSGIAGKGTFNQARQELKEVGLIDWKKEWEIIEENGRKIPRCRITYQITDSVLWDNRPINKAQSSTNDDFQSTDTVITVSEKEGVSNIGVKEQPSAVVNEYLKRGERSGSNPTAIDETLQGNLSPLDRLASGSDSNRYKTEWQVHAERVAKYLKLDVKNDSEWFNFFKLTYQKQVQKFLDLAASWCVDYEGTRDKKNLFFWKFNQVLKGE